MFLKNCKPPPLSEKNLNTALGKLLPWNKWNKVSRGLLFPPSKLETGTPEYPEYILDSMEMRFVIFEKCILLNVCSYKLGWINWIISIKILKIYNWQNYKIMILFIS